MYDITFEVLRQIMNSSTSIQDWWVGYYGKQVATNRSSPDPAPVSVVREAAVEVAGDMIDVNKDAPYDKTVGGVEPADTDMADAVVSPVQGVVEQARAIKKRRASSTVNRGNAKHRRRSTSKGRKRRR